MFSKDHRYFELLDLIQDRPDLSQREMAEHMRISVGSINYCLSALIDKGHVRVQNFRNSKNRKGYIYVLTTSGIQKRSALLSSFLKRKTVEYNRLKTEIERLSQELDSSGASLSEGTGSADGLAP